MDNSTTFYSKIFANLMRADEESRTFRRVAHLGTPAAEAVLTTQNQTFANDLLTNPDYDRFFLDRPGAVALLGGSRGVTAGLTATQLGIFRGAVDAASLVFMHSAVDAVTSDLCRLSSQLAVNDWEPFVRDQKVALKELQGAVVADLMRARVAEYIEALAKEGLLKRIDRLWAVCKPPATEELIGNYTFDRVHLEAIDRLRHQLVHGDHLGTPISDIHDTLDYLFRTGLFVFTMVNHRYDVRIDPLAVMKFRAGTMLPSDVAVSNQHMDRPGRKG